MLPVLRVIALVSFLAVAGGTGGRGEGLDLSDVRHGIPGEGLMRLDGMVAGAQAEGLVYPVDIVVGAQAASLVYPVDIVVGEQGTVVADFNAHGIFAIDDAGAVTAIARGEGLPRTPLYGTRAVIEAPDGDGWLVADPGTFGLYRVSAAGELSPITTRLDVPQGLVRFDDHSVLVSDARGGIGAVYRVTLDGAVTLFAEVPSPKGIAADGEEFVVVSHGDRALYRLSRAGAVSLVHRGAPFDYPHDVVLLPGGGYAVTDGYASAVFRVTPSGVVTELARGEPLRNPQGIAVGAAGELLVVDPHAGAVLRIEEGGAVERWVPTSGGR